MKVRLGAMISKRRGASAGYSQYEIVAAIFLVFLLLFGVLIMVMPGGGYDQDTGELDVPPYRWGNAIYIYNALQRVETGARIYYDLHHAMPGDSPELFQNATTVIKGDADGRIERGRMENVKFFIDLYKSGILPEETIRIRAKPLDIYWVELKAEGKVLAEGNFFKLAGINVDEARALDYKFDDARNDTGSVIYSLNDDGSGDVYVNFELF